MKIALLMFSFIFFSVIAYGYYNLLAGLGWFVATVFASVVAVTAWLIARIIGTTPDGIFRAGRNWFLMSVLLIVSAAGVYNTLMVTIEGGQILSDAATQSQEYFATLENAATSQLESSGVASRVSRIDGLKEALFSEMRNPRNCGEGPEAARIIGQLREELPEFRPVSGGRSGAGRRGEACNDLEPVIADYDSRISGLVARAPWNTENLRQARTEAARSQEELEQLRQDTSSGYNPAQLKQFVAAFEDKDADYRKARQKLAKETDVDGIPRVLPIVGVQSLGNIYKLPALIWSRLGYPSTWVYLLIAAGFDFMLVYLFELVTVNRVRHRAAPLHTDMEGWPDAG